MSTPAERLVLQQETRTLRVLPDASSLVQEGQALDDRDVVLMWMLVVGAVMAVGGLVVFVTVGLDLLGDLTDRPA